MRNLKLPTGIGVSVLLGTLAQVRLSRAEDTRLEDPVIITLTNGGEFIAQVSLARDSVYDLEGEIQDYINTVLPPKRNIGAVHASAPLRLLR